MNVIKSNYVYETCVPHFSFLSGFSSTTLPSINPQMDVRNEAEFRTKTDERKMLLYISPRSWNADGSERLGAVPVVIVF